MKVLHVITVTHTLSMVAMGKSLSTLLAQKRSTGACFLAHSLIYLQPPPPLSPLTHALRLQEFRAGYTRTPLNSTCWLHSNEYLTSVAKLITEQSLRALLTLYTHPPTHTCAHISKKQGLIYRSALQNNQSSPAQVY